MKKLLMVCCILWTAGLFGACPAAAATWNVKVDGSGDFPTIQAAVDAAGAGDEILIHPGVYTWANQGTESEYGMVYFARGVGGFTIRGVGGAGSTIWDAQGQGRVIFLIAYNTLTIEGITIKGGEAPGFSGDFNGGGIWAHLCYVDFIDCVITGNSARYAAGGGMWCGGVSAMQFVNCEFSFNFAEVGGGVFYINSTESPLMSGCVIRDNTAVTRGGGVYGYHNALTFETTIIAGNTAGQTGGAVYVDRVHPSTFTNCSVVGNDAGAGSGMYLSGGSDITLTNSIVAFGTGTGALVIDGGSILTVGCNDVYHNGPGGGIPSGAVDAGGNFLADPRFCGTVASYDYQLQDDTPCAPGNHPDGADCGLIGARPVGCGDVPVDYRSWGAIKALYRD